jgi:large subunit ribosomal protein L23
MAIFSKTEEKKGVAKQDEKKAVAKSAPKAADKKKADSAKASATKGAHLTKSPARILKSPRITEKAAYATEKGMYVFEVAQDATKRDVIAAVKAVYNVTPRKVNVVVKQPRKYVARFRGRSGTKSGMKKAYVFLKKGEKIDLM